MRVLSYLVILAAIVLTTLAFIIHEWEIGILTAAAGFLETSYIACRHFGTRDRT